MLEKKISTLAPPDGLVSEVRKARYFAKVLALFNHPDA